MVHPCLSVAVYMFQTLGAEEQNSLTLTDSVADYMSLVSVLQVTAA